MKKICSLILALTMLVSCMMSISVSADFALDNGETGRDILCSHIEFVEGYRYVPSGVEEEPDIAIPVMYAKSIVRDLNTTASTKAKDVTLICAGYDADGVLVDAAMSSGMNKMLKAQVDREGVSNYKAYVWDNEAMKPLTSVNRYDTALADINLEITFDGVSFADYIGENFDIGKSAYSKTIALSAGDAIELPEVVAKVSGGNGWAVVTGDADALTTTVTLYYGNRIATPNAISAPNNANSATNEDAWQTYSWSDKKVYTISYTLPELLGMNDVTYKAIGWDSGNVNYQDKYTKSYDLGTDSSKLVEIQRQDHPYMLIVLKATDNDKTGSVAALDSTGAEPTWVNAQCGDSTNPEIVSYTDDAGTERLKSAQVVTYTANNQSQNVWVYDKIKNVGPYSAGVMAFTGANMTEGTLSAITGVPADLEGCEYIVLPYGTGDKMSFYIRRDCEITCFVADGKNATLNITGSTDDGAWTKTDLTSGYPTRTAMRSTTLVSDLSKVVLIKEYGYTESDFDGNLPTDRTVMYRMQQAFSTHLLPSWTFTATGDTTKDAELAALTYEQILEKWKSVKSGILKGFTNVVTPNNVSQATAYEMQTLPLTDTTHSLFVRRTGLTQVADGVNTYTGLLRGYGDVQELDGATLFKPVWDWSFATDEVKAKTILSFTPERDVEAILMIAATDSHAPAGWIKIDGVDEEAAVTSVYNLRNPQNQVWSNIYVKKFEAGTPVVITAGEVMKNPLVIRPITTR